MTRSTSTLYYPAYVLRVDFVICILHLKLYVYVCPRLHGSRNNRLISSLWDENSHTWTNAFEHVIIIVIEYLNKTKFIFLMKNIIRCSTIALCVCVCVYLCMMLMVHFLFEWLNPTARTHTYTDQRTHRAFEFDQLQPIALFHHDR